jgi:hypothetical protein
MIVCLRRQWLDLNTLNYGFSELRLCIIEYATKMQLASVTARSNAKGGRRVGRKKRYLSAPTEICDAGDAMAISNKA